MKITNVEVFPLSYDIDDKPPRKRFFAILKLTTDEGLVGWGEASDCYGHHLAMTVKAYVDEQLRWWLLDQDPMQVEAVVERIRPQIYRYHGNRELVIQALSAAEIAMWDIRGKALGLPICELLGKRRDRVALYAADRPAFFNTPEEHIAWNQPLMDRGLTAFKVRIGHTFDADEKYVRAMRELIPAHVRMLVDGKYNYTLPSAIRMSYVLDEIGAAVWEEPVNDLDLDALAELADASPVPIAYGEHTFTTAGFRDLITHRAADILTPDATVCGGIATALEVGKMAHAFGLTVQPHCGGLTAIGMAANFHVAAALPSVDIFEFDSRLPQPLRDELITEPIFALDRIEGGCMPVPTGPGLGIEVNEDVIRRYPYELNESIARLYSEYATPHI